MQLHKSLFWMLCCFASPSLVTAQLYIAPGDSISILPGTQLHLQEDLQNNGKIYNGGAIAFNGAALQQVSGNGTIENAIADNDVVLVGNCTINDQLLINAGRIFNLGNFQLTNRGSIIGAGLLKGSSNAALVLTGGSSQLQFDNSVDGSSNALRRLSVGNSATIVQTKLYVYESLQPNAGTITLNDELVLRSNATGTARVGVVGSSFVYNPSGRFVVERYIPGRRAWRLLTAPVTASSAVKISEAWQDGAPRVTNVATINSTNNPRPGFGTHITFGMPATNGYDQGVNGNTSIRYLNATGWNGVPTATNDGSTVNSGIITDQPGYMLFVRGDRSTALWQATGAATTPTVLRPKGRINTGTLNWPIGAGFSSGSSVFRVVGNPYPSAINFHAVATDPVNIANGIPDAFYVWDPNITGNNGVGGFVGLTYNPAASAAAGRPVYNHSVSSSISDAGDIPSGAAIVIDYAGAAGTVRIQETSKSVETTTNYYRPTSELSVSLLAFNSDSTVSLNDGLLVSFGEQELAAVNKSDLQKLANFAENIAVWKDSMQLCLEKRPAPTSHDSVCLYLGRLRQKKYELAIAFAPSTLSAGIAPLLRDDYQQQVIPLQVTDSSRYVFTATNDPGSYRARRFTIVFKPVNRFMHVAASMYDNSVHLNWTIADTLLLQSFLVERSVDATEFHSVLTTADYSAVDRDVHPGTYYYRITSINAQGVRTMSEVIKVVVPANATNVYVYPNPVTEPIIQLFMRMPEGGSATCSLVDINGRLLQQQKISFTPGVNQYSIPMQSAYAAGTYQLQLIQTNKKTTIIPLQIQLK